MQDDVRLLHEPIRVEARLMAVRGGGREVSVSHEDNGAPFDALVSDHPWTRHGVGVVWWWVVAGEGKVKGAGSLGSLWNSGAGARLAKQLARGRWLAVPGRLCGVCSVVSYSPAPWRVQYHRRCQA